jgi:hypothetical protein
MTGRDAARVIDRTFTMTVAAPSLSRGMLTALTRTKGQNKSLLSLMRTACGGGGMGFDPHECDDSAAPGVWDVSLDYGGGKTGTQRWTISRHYCMLNIVAEPSDEYSPPSGYDVGQLTPGDPGSWASWINKVGECDYYVDMTVTIAGDSFTGPIDWNRKAHGTGQCLAAQGRIMATAARR